MKNIETWKPQYDSAERIINIEIHSPLRGEPPVTMQMAVMDFSGAETDLEAERRIETKKNPEKSITHNCLLFTNLENKN